MDSSTDEDSVLSCEDSRLRTPDSLDSYSQHHKSSNFHKKFRFTGVSDNAMPAFNGEDFYHFSNGKRKLEESSSEEDADQRYNSKLDEVNLGASGLEDSGNAKRSRLSSKEEITHYDMDKERYGQEIQPTNNVHTDKSQNDMHLGVALQIMEKMGYQPGKGLGKHSQGLVEPIAAANQRGRRGFGHHVPELVEAGLLWDPQQEEIKVVEDMEWLQSARSDCPENSEIDIDWVSFGPKKDTIEGEVNFCSPEILDQILKSKTIFDKLDKNEMRKARTRSNPYETIRSAGFLNRAAVKMANIDKACDFMFTNPKSADPNELLYFADVCAGPGGFSEYVLSRTKWHAKGFGFTLKDKNDFTLDEFFAGPSETFHPCYGLLDNGDVYEERNQEEFRKVIMRNTQNKGVHFMMADGGFSVEGQENIQEILSKQLYLCQCLVALMIVRDNGHFVTKLFDLFTPFSAGLVYLMYRCFDSICIFKPNSSRPANSERYLICKGKKKNAAAVIEYLTHVNRLLSTGDKVHDVTHIVALEVLEADKAFIEYLRRSNDTLGRKQILGLLKIAAFCENPRLNESKQAEMRKECLQYWGISNKTRVRPQMVKPQDKVREMLNNCVEFLGCEAKKASNAESFKAIVSQPYDWYCIPCSSGPFIEEDKVATFYLSLGKRKVFRYVRGQWHSVGDVKLELPENTLVYAELVYELSYGQKSFIKTRALHILDAYMLGGEDVSKLYISNRYRLTKKFCEAIRKPTPNDYVCVWARERFLVGPDINKKLRISQRYVKTQAFEFTRNSLERENEHFYIPFNSVLFIKSVAPPWVRHLSQKTHHFYVYNYDTKVAEYEVRNGVNNRPPEAEASFEQGFQERVIWRWPNTTGLNLKEHVTIEGLTTMIRNSLQLA